MAPVDVTVDLNADPHTVFEMLLDISRTPEWVTICRAVLHLDDGTPTPGWQCKQRYVLRGAPFVVTWTLDELTPDRHLSWSGRGPARSTPPSSRTSPHSTTAAPDSATATNSKRPAASSRRRASRALVGDTAEQEARDSLQRLTTLLHHH